MAAGMVPTQGAGKWAVLQSLTVSFWFQRWDQTEAINAFRNQSITYEKSKFESEDRPGHQHGDV